MELFNEVKNKYFRIVTKVLNESREGLTKDKVMNIFDNEGYSQKLIDKKLKSFSGMLLNDYHYENNFNLLEYNKNKYYPIINTNNIIIPIRLTINEMIWLKAMLSSDNINMFLDENLIKKLVYELKDIDNSIKNEYIEFTNVIKKHKDFDKENYKNNFKKILKAILYNKIIVYDNIDKFDNSYHGIEVLPVNIEYSLRDNIFRVSIYLISDKKIVMVDIYSMDNIKILDKKPEITREYVLEQQYMQKYSKDPIVLEVFDKRQAMERCFMCFSGLERTAKIISENKYELTLKYYLFNEEKIIRSILSLGPYVKVISPMRIKNNIIERLKKSFDLFGNN